MSNTQFQADRQARTVRRRTRRPRTRQSAVSWEEGGVTTEAQVEHTVETSPEEAEAEVIAAQLAGKFGALVAFYKSEMGGSLPQDKAVAEAEFYLEQWRETAKTAPPRELQWAQMASVAMVDVKGALGMWVRVREAADDDLAAGKRAARVAGAAEDPWTLAQFLAIRDAFADQWQPQGGIESALIDMLTIAFSLQMYWSEIAHIRATETHDEMRKELAEYESRGWKAPRVRQAESIEQAYRLADGYNRQFLRVLRQLRDLRRYAPPVIVNNGGQVNVANQQVNMAKQD